jgi:predicted ATPase
LIFEKLNLPKGQERVAILVGPNGSGKSNLLKAIASEVRHYRNVVVISNTGYDRFAGMRGFDRLSAGRSGRSPKSIVKAAVARTIDAPSSLFYQMGAILQYCGYRPRFGFRMHLGRKQYFWQSRSIYQDPEDLQASLAFLERHDPREIVWIDQFESKLDFSLSREFASVLRNEEFLIRERLLSKPVEVYLTRGDDGIELKNASSGELALISSLVYLVTTNHPEPLILIDEPENSLHPVWQRDYVARVLTALEYRGASIVIATHAPLIVTGALVAFQDIVSVFQMRDAQPVQLDLSESTEGGSSIEEILWRAFEVITPANHFVSEKIMGLVTQLERGEITQTQALAVVGAMHQESFDERQRRFFDAVRELIEKIGGGNTPRDQTDA